MAIPPGRKSFDVAHDSFHAWTRKKIGELSSLISALSGEGKTFASVNYAATSRKKACARFWWVWRFAPLPMLEDLFTGKRGSLPGVTDYFLGRRKFVELACNTQDIAKLF